MTVATDDFTENLMFETRHGHDPERKEVGLLNTEWPRKARIDSRLLQSFVEGDGAPHVTVNEDVVQFKLSNAEATYKIGDREQVWVTCYLIEGKRDEWPYVKPAQES